MENLESPFVVLLQITEAFKVLDIDYVVVGAIASSIHGEYRASGDIDIVADLNSHHVDPLVLSLSDKFYVDDLSVRRAIANCRSFNVINTEAIFKVDIFVPRWESNNLRGASCTDLIPTTSRAFGSLRLRTRFLASWSGTAKVMKAQRYNGATFWESSAPEEGHLISII
jgi:hypothetical protein